MTEQEMVMWLEAHGYQSYGGGGSLHRGFYGVREFVGAVDSAVAVKVAGRGVRLLRMDADSARAWGDRTWLAEMETLIESGALTPLEARHKYAAEIAELYRQQQEAAA